MLGPASFGQGFEQWLVPKPFSASSRGIEHTQAALCGQYSLCADEKGEFMVVDTETQMKPGRQDAVRGRNLPSFSCFGPGACRSLVELASKGVHHSNRCSSTRASGALES